MPNSLSIAYDDDDVDDTAEPQETISNRTTMILIKYIGYTIAWHVCWLKLDWMENSELLCFALAPTLLLLSSLRY